MSFLEIEGGYPLYGEIKVQGSKNAVLPILAASLLVRGTTVLTNCPDISDVACMVRILRILGCKVEREGHTLLIDASDVLPDVSYEEEAGKMRSSVMLAGALLGRLKETFISSPGGCSIGERPIDIHLEVFKALGAKLVDMDYGIRAWLPVKAESKDCEYTFPYPSVGATENGILAAVLRKGRTVYKGVAKEPEILALCHFLNQAGASITGIGSGTLIIEGAECLQESTFAIPGDRIVALTYLAAGAITKGDLTVKDVPVEELRVVNHMFAQMGCRITEYSDAVRLQAPKSGRMYALPYMKTDPYPGFPTDMQSQMMALCCVADGVSKIEEAIFENRYQTAEELKHMEADIHVAGKYAIIYGKECLRPAEVYAKDLRGGAALILAALGTEGMSRICDMFYVERGYEKIDEVLSQLGAKISGADKCL